MYPASKAPAFDSVTATDSFNPLSLQDHQQRLYHASQQPDNARPVSDRTSPHRSDYLSPQLLPLKTTLPQSSQLQSVQSSSSGVQNMDKASSGDTNQSSRTIHAGRAGPSAHQAWNSRSGISLPGQSWPSEPSTSHHGAHVTHLTPPGLNRPPFDPSPGSSPGLYNARTAQDFSSLPNPIARPNPGVLYGEGSSSQGPKRRSSGKDEFDGPHQFLPKPDDAHIEISETQLIHLPVSLHAEEQEEVLSKVNDCLSKSAFDFVAKYQFPIPIEADKRPVRVPSDREWTEWCHLLKRLATKRRIPMRVLWNGQIKQLVTVLENSLEMRHAAKQQSRPLKDDRNVLQLISAAMQVTKMLKDPQAMIFLDALYTQTERVIRSRTRS